MMIGIDLGGTKIEGIVIDPPGVGGLKSVNIIIYIPALHQGNYAFNIFLSYRDSVGKMHSLDGIYSAITFELHSNKKVHVLMSLPTEFEL